MLSRPACPISALFAALILSVTAATAAPRTTYKVATEGSFAPFEFYDARGELAGFDIDLIHAIGAEMGFAVTFADLPFAEVLPALDNGQADIAIAAIAITPERMSRYAFSDCYHTGGQRLTVRKEIFGRVHDLGGVMGEAVCVERGSNGHELLIAIKHPHILECSDNSDCNRMFNAGQCRALIRNDDVTRHDLYTGALSGAKITDLEITRNEFGIAVSQKSPALLSIIDEGLIRLTRNGTLRELEKRWFPSGEDE